MSDTYTPTTERQMLDRLLVRYAKVLKNGDWRGREFARAEHVPIGVGFERSRIADFLAVRMIQSTGFEHLSYPELSAGREAGTIPPYSSRTPTLIGHEVKVSRSDWLHELKQPEKAEAWKQFCHEWFLVVSDLSIVRDGELPDGWGLMVSHGRSLRMVKRAPRLAPVPMGMTQIAALTRAVTQTEVRAASPVHDEGEKPFSIWRRRSASTASSAGFDAAHDRQHGIDHLLQWADEYAARGKVTESRALLRAAREQIASLHADLDDARAAGEVFTYGQMQRRLAGPAPSLVEENQTNA